MLMKDVNNRGSWMYSIWEFPTTSSQLFCKFKTILNDSVYFKKLLVCGIHVNPWLIHVNV